MKFRALRNISFIPLQNFADLQEFCQTLITQPFNQIFHALLVEGLFFLWKMLNHGMMLQLLVVKIELMLSSFHCNLSGA